MRLSETKVAQLVDSIPPTVVIVDTQTGEEIALSVEEVEHLMQALAYFTPALGLDD